MNIQLAIDIFLVVAYTALIFYFVFVVASVLSVVLGIGLFVLMQAPLTRLIERLLDKFV